MKGEVIAVDEWTCHAPPKAELYLVTVRLENRREICFIQNTINAPPKGLWEGDKVEVVYRKNKDDGMVLPFIVQ